MKLLIFDIDGTLTHLDGATRQAFDSAYQRLFDRPAKIDGIPMHGRTDPMIFRDTFKLSGFGDDWEPAYKRFCDVYIEELPAAIAAKGSRVHLHKGVEILLARLNTMPDRAALVLGTGNMEAGGRAKISHFGINDYFPVGGFGDFHHGRPAILRDAVLHAERHWNREFDPSETWVIGDTPFDVQGGKELGLRTLAVATSGIYSLEQLAHTWPDAVFADLSDTDTVLSTFGLA